MNAKKGLFAAALSMTALLAVLCVSGCNTEKQFPGGDNDDSRKAPAAAPKAAAAPAADTSHDKAGSSEPGGK